MPPFDPTARAWVGIVANPHSGRGRARARVDQLQSALKPFGFETRTAWSLDQHTRLIHDADQDHRCHSLVAVGGDGTASALLHRLPRVPVSVLPTGTENLFARHFKLSPRPEVLAQTLASGQARHIDLGRFQDRRFALMAGFGFDAEVVSRHHAHRTRRTGLPRITSRLDYVIPTLAAASLYRFPKITFQIHDPQCEESLSGTSAILFNLPRYALGLPFAPNASAHDGMLDLVIFRHAGPWQALRYLWLVARGKHLDRTDIHHRRVKSLSVSAESTVPVQLDGDPAGIIGPQPVRIDTQAQSVAVIAPVPIARSA